MNTDFWILSIIQLKKKKKLNTALRNLGLFTSSGSTVGDICSSPSWASVAESGSVYFLRIHGGRYLLKSIVSQRCGIWVCLLPQDPRWGISAQVHPLDRTCEFLEFLEHWTMEIYIYIYIYIVGLNRYELYRATTSNVSYNNDYYKRLLDESG